MHFIKRYLWHHGRFYAALVLGVLAFFLAGAIDPPLRAAAGSDAFFLSYILSSLVLTVRLTHKDLAKRAAAEDEGAVIVFAITIAAITFACIDIFFALNHSAGSGPWVFALSIAGAPLSWLMLHTVMAFHYANLHYACADKPANTYALEFPGTAKPEPWDFLYFSFVVGMTSQTSDTLIKDTDMRRTVMMHGIASFLFNTVLISMAVNAGLTNAH